MYLCGRHVTRFFYSTAVWCLPLTIRLKPRSDYRQRLLAFSLEIEPQPKGLSQGSDLEGNDVTLVLFDSPLTSLTIATTFEAETEDVNPFGFVLRPDALRLPLVPAAEEEQHFEYYGRPRDQAMEVEELAHEVARKVDFGTVQFLCELNEWIHGRHEKIERAEGNAWQPQQTLREARGACRDLAVLFIECCRVMGIPSRFVSGYGARVDESGEHELHAWAEVYLPGAGWRGFDPSLGLALTERHLSLAIGATAEMAAPTSGQFQGNAESRLESEVQISVRERKEGSVGA